jgi:magnesium-protoporphyrin O-methyltransferase
MLLEAVKQKGVEGNSLLDVGGGFRVLQHELLRAGVGRADSVEASTAYIDACKQEAARQDHEDRITYHNGDFVDIAPNLDRADIVTLERVICCYPDVETLVELSSRLADRVYGLVYPRTNWASKIAARLFNLIMWLRRSSFRVFIHPDSVIDWVTRSNGLRPISRRKTLVWQVVIYER